MRKKKMDDTEAKTDWEGKKGVTGSWDGSRPPKVCGFEARGWVPACNFAEPLTLCNALRSKAVCEAFFMQCLKVQFSVMKFG